MFDKKKYYNQSKLLENASIVAYIIYCAIFITLGIIKYELRGIFWGFTIAFITGYFPYLKCQIKAEEMKMMIEIHDNLKELNSKENHELENKI